MWKDSETELDFLDYDCLINTLKDIINNEDLLPASIGVYGDWGSGKSSLMQMCKKQLEKEDKNIKCLVFNGWLFENYDDAKTAILGTILDEIGKNTNLGEKAKKILKGLYSSVDKFKLLTKAGKIGLDFVLTGGIGTLTNITVDSIIRQLPPEIPGVDIDNIRESVHDELNNKELRDDIRKFQKDFSELLDESKISKLVVFVDELDRCTPDTILNTLEAIKLFLFNGNVAFIIGADERHISYAVKNKFKDIEGIQIDIGKEYLEKLIQYPIRIPRLNEEEVETYITALLLQKELPKDVFNKWVTEMKEERKKDFLIFSVGSLNYSDESFSEYNEIIMECLFISKQLSAVLSRALHGNPRQCKRFLNSLIMRLNMAKYKNKTLDRKILAKIMVLEYIRPALFNKMAIMCFEGTLQNELELLEQKKYEDLQEFSTWKDDNWIKEWCEISPMLSNLDLKIYFYFMRTSLEEKISRISNNLSPKGQEILDQLLTFSDINVNKAISSIADISISERVVILQTIYDKISSKSSIDTNEIKCYLKYSQSDTELYSDSLDYLKKLRPEQITFGSAPHIAEYAKKTKSEKQILQLLTDWGEAGSNLQKAVVNALKK